MDYNKIYNSLIDNRMSIKEDRIKLKRLGNYFEKHHIILKCKGGDNSYNNIVFLTAREHYLAHWLLWLIFKDRQTALAFHKMSSINKFQERINSSIKYEIAREAYRITNIGNNYGKNNKGNIRLDLKGKLKPKHAESMKGINNYFYGKKHSYKTKKILSDAAKLRVRDKHYNYKGNKILFKNNEIVGIFQDIKILSKFINCSESNISHVLAKKQKTAKNYNIMYEEDFIKDSPHRIALLNKYKKLYNV